MGSDDHEKEESEHHFSDFGIGMFVLALTFGIIARSASAGARLVDKSTRFGRYERNLLSLFTRFPYTVLVMLVGLVIGAGLHLHHNAYGQGLGESLDHWSSVSPEVILFSILPILLFESAFSSDVHIMRHEAPQIFALAVPGVILQAGMMAVFSKYTFDYGDNWNWYTALMFGSMMSATDPVAVVALVKELGMNARIGTLIEGEGLMNDGSAIVLFNVFRIAITSREGLTAGGVIGTAFRLSLGGPIVGVAIGAATSACLAYFTYNDLQSEVTLTIVGCYSCFLVAEGTPLAVSGVLAVVFCGLYLSFYGRGNISVKVEHSLHAFWHMAEYIADTLIFFVAGVVMASKMLAADINSGDWANLFSFFFACQVIRAINILVCWPVLQQGYGVSWQEGAFLVFGGLRGAVGLCLALVVETEIEDEFLETRLKNKIVFLMSGVAFLSLILNGTLILPLVKYLKLDRVSKSETEMFDHACLVIERHLEHFVESDLKTDAFLGDADYNLVWRYMPVMSAQQYWSRIQSKKIVISRKEKLTMRAIYISDRQVAQGNNLESPLSQDYGRPSADHSPFKTFDKTATGSLSRAPTLSPSFSSAKGSNQVTPTSSHAAAREGPSEAFGSLRKKKSCTGPANGAAGGTANNSLKRSNSSSGITFSLPPPPPTPPLVLTRSSDEGKGSGDGRFFFGSLSSKSTSLRAASAAEVHADSSHHGSDFDGPYAERPSERPSDMSWLGKDGWGSGHAENTGSGGGGSFGWLWKGAQAGIDAFSEVNTAYLTIPPRLRPYWHSLHHEYFSLGDKEARDRILRKGDNDASGRKHHPNPHPHRRNTPTPASLLPGGGSNPKSMQRSNSSQSADRGRFNNNKKNANSLSVVLPRYSEYSSFGMAVGSSPLTGNSSRKGSGTNAGSLRRRSKNSSSGVNDGPLSGSLEQGSAFFTERGNSNLQLLREHQNLLNQLKAVKENLDANERARAKSSEGFTPRDPSTATNSEESLEKARTRFITAVRAHYQANHHLGRMKASVLRTLRESADRQLDDPSQPLHDFDYLEDKLTMSPRLQLLAQNFAGVPFVAALLNHFIYVHLAFMIELASEFVRAHTSVEIRDLLDEGLVADDLAKENSEQLKKVNALLMAQLPVFPEITHALKTQTATRQLLMYQMRLTDDLVEEGTITEKEYEALTHKTDEMLIKLHGHPLTEKLPQKVDMLLSADFLKGVALEDIERLAQSGSFATEIFVEPNVKLFTAGSSCVTGGPSLNKHGWFLLVRGNVLCSETRREFGSNEPYRQKASTSRFRSGGRSLTLSNDSQEGTTFDNGSGSYCESESEVSEIQVQPGSTFGLVEQLLGAPFEQDFTTTTYCHLLYIETTSALREVAKPTDAGRSVFEAMFRASAVTLVPHFLGLENAEADPLGLVSSQHRFSGWDPTAFAYLTSATSDNRKQRRLLVVANFCNQSDGNDFLGLGSLESAVFLRPVEEDVVKGANHTSNHSTANGGAPNFSPDALGNKQTSPTGVDSSHFMGTMDTDLAGGSGSSGNFGGCGSGVAAKRLRGFVRLQSVEVGGYANGSGGGGRGEKNGSFNKGNALQSAPLHASSSSSSSSSAAAAAAAATGALLTGGGRSVSDNDATGSPRHKLKPELRKSSSVGEVELELSSSPRPRAVRAAVRRASSFMDVLEHSEPTNEEAGVVNERCDQEVLSGDRVGAENNFNKVTFSFDKGSTHGPAPTPRKGKSPQSKVSLLALAHLSGSSSMEEEEEEGPQEGDEDKFTNLSTFISENEDDKGAESEADSIESLPPPPPPPLPKGRSPGKFAHLYSTSNSDDFPSVATSSNDSLATLAPDGDDDEQTKKKKTNSLLRPQPEKAPPPLPPVSSGVKSSQRFRGSVRSTSTTPSPNVATRKTFSPPQTRPLQGGVGPGQLAVGAQGGGGAAQPQPARSRRPSFVASAANRAALAAKLTGDSTSSFLVTNSPALGAVRNTASVRSGTNNNDGDGGGVGAMMMGSSGGGGAGGASSSSRRGEPQWVIPLLGSKTYLLLRGRINGRAEESSSTREATHIIESAQSLAQTASALEVLSRDELEQLQELLQKLHGTPVKNSGTTSANSSSTMNSSSGGGGSMLTGSNSIPMLARGFSNGSLASASGSFALHASSGSAVESAGGKPVLAGYPNKNALTPNNKSFALAGAASGDLATPMSPKQANVPEPATPRGPPPGFLNATNQPYVANPPATQRSPDLAAPLSGAVRAANGTTKSFSGGQLNVEHHLHHHHHHHHHHHQGEDHNLFVKEHVAPCLVSRVKGRVSVSARTVIMEIPVEVRYGAKAALRFLTLFRQKQEGLGSAVVVNDDGNDVGETSDEEDVSGESCKSSPKIKMPEVVEMTMESDLFKRRGSFSTSGSSSDEDEEKASESGVRRPFKSNQSYEERDGDVKTAPSLDRAPVSIYPFTSMTVRTSSDEIVSSRQLDPPVETTTEAAVEAAAAPTRLRVPARTKSGTFDIFSGEENIRDTAV